MSDHDANVRLNLAASGMLSMLQVISKHADELAKNLEGVGDEGKKAEKKLSPFMESAKKGAGAAKTAMLDLGSSIKSVAGQVLTLGGAVSMAGAAKQAMDLRSHYEDIAFAIRTGTGEAMRWEQVQERVEKTATKWKRSNNEVAHSFDELFRESNDVKFAEKATEAAAKFAAASGKPIEVFTGIADQLRDKFDIAADDVEDAMARIASTNKVEEFGANMEALGASARSLGLSGKEGLSQMIGMLEASGGATKDLKKGIVGLSGVLETLTDPTRAQAIEKSLKVKLRTDDGEVRKDAIEQLLKGTGGQKEELSKVFSGDALKIMTEYGKIYSQAFDDTSGNFKRKSEAGLEAFNKALADAAKQKLSVDDVTAQAEKKLREPSANIQAAINKVTNAFNQPKLIAAVDKIAEKAPMIADAFAKLIEFAADHPLLAGAGLVAGKAGMAMGGSMLNDAGSAIFDRTLGKLGKQIFSPKEAAEAGEALAKSAGISPAWKMAGGAIGLVAAGLVAKAMIDSHFDDKDKEQGDTVMAGVEAAGAASSGDLARMLEARKTLAARYKELDDSKDSVANRFMRGLGQTIEGDDFRSGDDKVRYAAAKDLADLDAAIAKAQAANEKGAGASDKAAGAQDRLATAAEKAARRLEAIASGGGGGNGTNGLPNLGG